jgi:predicted MFS family arabinose efflux permease
LARFQHSLGAEAIGSAVGGVLYEPALLHAMGFVGAIFVALALAIVYATRPRSPGK